MTKMKDFDEGLRETRRHGMQDVKAKESGVMEYTQDFIPLERRTYT